jgi:hypothetical protein
MQDGRIRELVREMLPEPTGPAIVVSGAVGGSYSDRLRIMDL